MERVQEFIDTCRARGLNVTYQRILIYKTLMKTRSHPTAEAIYHEVKAEYPAISLATVYKTLETLAENDLIAKVTPLHDLARFDGDTSPHHHLVCLNCRKIEDVHDDAFNSLDLPPSDTFIVHGYRIQFEGYCRACTEHQDVRDKIGDDVTFCGKSGKS